MREGGLDDFGEAFRGLQLGQIELIEPSAIVQFLFQAEVAGKPARRESENDEMPFHPAVVIARGHFTVRRLEKVYGKDLIKKEYNLLAHES